MPKNGLAELVEVLFHKYGRLLHGTGKLTGRGVSDFLALSNFLHGSF